MLDVILTLLDEWAVIRGARHAVWVRNHASTDALAGIYIDRNRLDKFFVIKLAGSLDKSTHLLLLFLPVQSLERGVQRVFL